MKKLIAFVLAFMCMIGLVGCSSTDNPTLFHYFSLKKECESNRDIPRVDINTFGKRVKSKEEYIDCTITISGTEIDEYSAGIRGRGNSTWGLPKKPYRIKFDEKVSVFGEAKNKSWVLLALYGDFYHGLLRHFLRSSRHFCLDGTRSEYLADDFIRRFGLFPDKSAYKEDGEGLNQGFDKYHQ